MKIVTEEAFGPVMLLMKFDTDEEVVEYANGTGLQSVCETSLWSGIWQFTESVCAQNTACPPASFPRTIAALRLWGPRLLLARSVISTAFVLMCVA